MRIALTGAGGFLGLHTRVAANSLGYEVGSVGLGSKFHCQTAMETINGSDCLIHVAGVNRGSDTEVHDRNLEFATQLSDALRRVNTPPPVVVYANSIQAGNSSAYGQAKAEAAEVLQAAAISTGARFCNVLLPNLFGEHGRPFYNSVVATFCHLLNAGQTPEILDDKDLALLHVQDAADVLLGSVPSENLKSLTASRTVSAVLEQLQEIAHVYRKGEIPALKSNFDLGLFNTYRSFRLQRPLELPFMMSRRADARGSFFEVCRSKGGEGQTSFSTTLPGVTRGQHFHRRKVERFVVLHGRAEIAIRCLFSDDVLLYKVDGSEPVAIDMPTLWTHNITNTGDSELFTMFWANEIFDPVRPDTFPEKV
ncbi:UDP-2-acetamido-2,6-beta-L-arabino-hexul-4-ose reductase [Arthrobacter sp. B2I5]|uniref:polysaccharide biosynthesis C-terminal domain-containing protein n=1 Tax=Arthrobacter sp. B2I5 TaxID=3042266 RepID=UPI00278A0F8E|nr:NAD-dependent epimerase/dehydratase family protein [Arthrobacter sp. B2I5]MDQ0824663.1 UDP-2-acetamido-2,6-beta-L-arabino-hexul-4-ose reductase [Arthrobacter sp. B2I5]